MLIFRLILRSGRVNDSGKRRLTTDKGNLTRNKYFNKEQNRKGQGPVVEISGSEAVEAVEAE